MKAYVTILAILAAACFACRCTAEDFFDLPKQVKQNTADIDDIKGRLQVLEGEQRLSESTASKPKTRTVTKYRKELRRTCNGGVCSMEWVDVPYTVEEPVETAIQEVAADCGRPDCTCVDCDCPPAETVIEYGPAPIPMESAWHERKRVFNSRRGLFRKWFR